jgi:predicted AAA+ superfamily ATPase
MNENHSRGEWTYRPRWAAAPLRQRLKDFPVLAITGPRQVGKSTLLRHESPVSDFDYIDLDDLELRARIQRDPELPWEGRDRVVVDEVQRIPQLLTSLKAEVDRRSRRMQVVISGSANLLLMRGVSESLAGRAAHLDLLPCSLGEWRGSSPPDLLSRLLKGSALKETKVSSRAPSQEIYRGLLPPARLARRPEIWWEAYVRTYLERDLRDLSMVQSLPDFRRLLELVALRNGQIVNESEVASGLGLSQPTVHRWINLLEISQLLLRLPAYTANRGKRLMKRPKYHLVDPGLAAFLCGLHSAKGVEAAQEYGALFETLVLSQLRVLASLMTPRASLFHWRTSDGKEVDLVLTQGRRMTAFECKCTRRARAADTGHLRLFRKLHPQCKQGVLVYAGNRVQNMGEGIVALPWTLLAGL